MALHPDDGRIAARSGFNRKEGCRSCAHSDPPRRKGPKSQCCLSLAIRPSVAELIPPAPPSPAPTSTPSPRACPKPTQNTSGLGCSSGPCSFVSGGAYANSAVVLLPSGPSSWSRHLLDGSGRERRERFERLSTTGEPAYDDETAKEKLEAAERKSSTGTLANWNAPAFWCRALQARPQRDDDGRRLPGH
jgi:hypothetical protein